MFNNTQIPGSEKTICGCGGVNAVCTGSQHFDSMHDTVLMPTSCRETRDVCSVQNSSYIRQCHLQRTSYIEVLVCLDTDWSLLMHCELCPTTVQLNMCAIALMMLFVLRYEAHSVAFGLSLLQAPV